MSTFLSFHTYIYQYVAVVDRPDITNKHPSYIYSNLETNHHEILTLTLTLNDTHPHLPTPYPTNCWVTRTEGFPRPKPRPGFLVHLCINNATWANFTTV